MRRIQNKKATDLLHKTGEETISGKKTFTTAPVIDTQDNLDIRTKKFRIESNESNGHSSVQQTANGINGKDFNLRINKNVNANGAGVQQYGSSEWWYPYKNDGTIMKYDLREEKEYYDFDYDINNVVNAKKAVKHYIHRFDIHDKFSVVDGKTFVDMKTQFGSEPVISLAIGDSDTGFNWKSDGALEVYGNNVKTQEFYNGRSPMAWHGRNNTSTIDLTQQQYDALGVKDHNTLYLIRES